MNTNIGSTKTQAENGESTFCPTAYAGLFSKGLKQVAEVSKTSFDFAIEQNTKVLTSYNKALSSSLRGLFWFNLAGEVVERYVTLQESLLGLALKQSTAVIQAAQECGLKASKSLDQEAVVGLEAKPIEALSAAAIQQPSVTVEPFETIVGSVQGGVDTQPTTEIVQVITLQPQPGVIFEPVEPVADSVQLRVDTLLAKEIVDLAIEPMKPKGSSN